MARSPKLDGAQADEEDNKARSEFHLKRAPRRMAENPERGPTTEVSGDGALVRSARPRKTVSLSENKDKPSES